jgi:hypothetical protein
MERCEKLGYDEDDENNVEYYCWNGYGGSPCNYITNPQDCPRNPANQPKK